MATRTSGSAGGPGKRSGRKTGTAPRPTHPCQVRDNARVVSKALVVAYAVSELGVREVIGLDIGEVESEAFWTEFLRSLRAGGLDGVRLVVSDHHEGLKNAIARTINAPWQRCTVHFVRNTHGHCRPSQRGLVSAALREVFNATTKTKPGAGSARSSSAWARLRRRSPSCSRTPKRT